MLGILNLKSARIPSLAVAPLPLITVLFKLICSRRFDHRVYYYKPKIDGPSTTYYNRENKTMANKDNTKSKNFVGFRFGDPAFYAELPIPMVHESVRHLLPKLYGSGKTERIPFISRMTRQKSVRHLSVIQLKNATGGELQFQSVTKEDLELDDSTEGIKGMYKFNEDQESANIVDSPKTNYYSNSFSPPIVTDNLNPLNPLKRLSNRLSNSINKSHTNTENDIYSPQRPLVDRPSMMEIEYNSSYYHETHHQQYQRAEPPNPNYPTTNNDMEYFVAGQAYRTHNPRNLNSSNAIEMSKIYRDQQQSYQPVQQNTVVGNYNQYIRNPVSAYTGHGRAKNYHQDIKR